MTHRARGSPGAAEVLLRGCVDTELSWPESRR